MSTDNLALSCLFSPEDHLRLNPLGVTLPLRRLLGPPAPEDAGSQWRAGLRKGWHMGCSQQQEGVIQLKLISIISLQDCEDIFKNKCRRKHKIKA